MLPPELNVFELLPLEINKSTQRGPITFILQIVWPSGAPFFVFPRIATTKERASCSRTSWLQPNRPDQWSTMHPCENAISWNSMISLAGYTQMFFGTHQCWCFFQKQKTVEQHRKPEFALSLNDLQVCWAPWIHLWPLFAPLRFQINITNTHLRKHMHFRKH